MVDLKPENDIYCAECHLTFARAEPRVIIAGKTYHQSCSVKYEASSEHPQDVLASAAQAIVPAIGRLVSKSESTKPSTADDKQHASELRKKAAKAERTVAKEL